MPLAETQAKRCATGGPGDTLIRVWSRAWTIAGISLLALLLAVSAASCSSASAGPVLAPLGAYETEVGVPWSHPLVALDDGAGGLVWTLLEGPQDMQISATNALVWVATAFDLALGPPGQPRAAGPRQTIRLRACDRAKRCVAVTGSIRAVPSPR